MKSKLSLYERDLERIIHSNAYARYFDKTQVVYLVPYDHLTRRGLHVQFVSMFSRMLGKRLGLNLDLIEAIALGHDVGHPPFGHEGEGYLSSICKEMGLGAFSHANQSCRLFEVIEPLDLSFEVHDGFLCHDGGMKSRVSQPNLDKTAQMHIDERKLRTVTPEVDLIPKTAEALLVKLSDTVSYLGRDIEDAIALRLIERKDVPWGMLGSSNHTLLEAARHDILTLYGDTGQFGFSEEMYQTLKKLRKFNFECIYWHPKLKTESKKIEQAYKLLFENLLTEWLEKREESLLWTAFLHSRTQEYLVNTVAAQYVVDFIAGMTDRYFLKVLQERLIPQKIEVTGVHTSH